MKKLFFIGLFLMFAGIGCASTPKVRSIQNVEGKAIQVVLESTKKDSSVGGKVKAYQSFCRTNYRRGVEAISCKKTEPAEGIIIDIRKPGSVLVEFPVNTTINANTEYEME